MRAMAPSTSSFKMPTFDPKVLGLGALALGGYMYITDKKKKKK
jgi:hypothetical protein